MQIFHALDADHATLGSKWGKHDVGAVCLNDLPHFVHPGEEDAVDLGGGNLYVFDEEPDSQHTFVQLILGLLNRLRSLACDQDLLDIAPLCVGWTVPIGRRKRRREIYRGSSCRFDELDILPITATNELMKRKVDLGGVDNPSKLRPC